MKKLKGMKKDFSSFENLTLNELKSITGGRLLGGYYEIQSNVFVGEGCVEYDHYNGPNGTGGYIYREIRRLQPGEPIMNY